ncbi:tetratricopeptide repeat protein [Amycolatopsis sp. 195334CR]|uniref:tetratricopeptide repeat protein n=1 Tax=Amycolatopsis sp. 195334CR TaxID=2814588 RepID=UPI001A8FF4E2|nr:tetratricopeptide repeat protein [Amycolatopsis sp. 195334CR]MBN6040041.1 tetratricopeptide repeat protein [Amycolatopsis sp. 195334CR]
MTPNPENDPGPVAADGAVGASGGGSLVADAEGHARVYQSLGDMTIIARPGAPEGPAVVPVSVQVDQDAVFVGRGEQIDELLSAFGEHRDAGVVVSAGMGGVGKTALVTRAAARAVEQGLVAAAVVLNLNGYDPDPVQRAKPRDVLGPLLRVLGLADADVRATVPEQLMAYHALLSAWEQQGRRLLLVLDNAGDSEQIAPLLPPAPHAVVVTTRDTLTLPGRTRHLDLDTLPMTDAIDLLTQLLQRTDPEDPRSGEGAALVRLADQCGRLPLALEIAAAVLADEPSMTVADLAGELAATPHTLESLRRADRSVAAVLELSWHRLSERHPAAAELLSLLPINPGPDLSTTTAAALADTSEAQVKPRLRALRHAHLLQLADGRWRMHDLVRQNARTHLTDQHRDPAVRRLLEHYDRLADAADAHLRALPDDSVPDTFPGRAEALDWFDTERANLTSAVAVALDTGHHDLAIQLAAALSVYLSWRRHLVDQVTVSEHAITAAQHLNTPRIFAIASNNLGVALREVRRFDEAITHHQQAAAIYREIGDRHGEGQALNNLGVALREVRRFDEAITAHERDLAIFRETGDRHDVATALNNLGLALRAVRRFDEAITAHEQDLAICRETGDRHREGQALNNLGYALREVRRFDEAITHHQQAAAIYRETGDRHREGLALNNLGNALQEVRRFDEAITHHQQAAAIYRETGDRHREGQALGNLGIALREVRRFDEAITHHQQAAAIFRETGDRHGEGQALGNLGIALREVRRFDEAITHHQQAAAIFRETGDRHGEGQALTNLGNAFAETGQLVEAQAAGQAAVSAFEEAGDPESAATVTEWLSTLQ